MVKSQIYPVKLINKIKSFLYTSINDQIKFIDFIENNIIKEYLSSYTLWCENPIFGEEPLLRFTKYKHGELSGLTIIKVKDTKVRSITRYAYNHLKKHVKHYNLINKTKLKPPTVKELQETGLEDNLIVSFNKNKNTAIKRPEYLLIHKHLPFTTDNIFAGTIDERNQYLISLPDKYCSKCNRILNKEEFKSDTSKSDNLYSSCKTCVSKYRRSKDGLLTSIYNRQCYSSKFRKHSPPAYSKEKLIEWCLNQQLFHNLYNAWRDSNYNKDLTPSIDRIDNSIGYNITNIQLMTWKENEDKGRSEIVYQYKATGEFIKKFDSVQLAIKDVGGSNALRKYLNLNMENRPKLYKTYIWSKRKKHE